MKPSVLTRSVPHPDATGRRRRRGFTMVSMLMAIILLAVGLMSLAGANAQTVTMQTLAQNRTSAIAIARTYMEQVRTRDPWSIQSESAVALNNDGVPSGGGRFIRSMTVTETRQNLIKIEVNVSYPRGTQPVQLTTSYFRGNGLSGAE
jgi:Tfp pilus assembly protein PilV